VIDKTFVTAGRAIFTVSNPAGQHYTFRIRGKESEQQVAPVFFAELLTGPNNTDDYTYLGILDHRSGDVRLTKKSAYTADTLPVRVLTWAMRLTFDGKPEPAGYRLQHEGRCGRCGRVLTVPSSIESGIGPECATKLGVK